eukprot:8541274-Pyramimonas_sp.AAC.1
MQWRRGASRATPMCAVAGGTAGQQLAKRTSALHLKRPKRRKSGGSRGGAWGSVSRSASLKKPTAAGSP